MTRSNNRSPRRLPTKSADDLRSPGPRAGKRLAPAGAPELRTANPRLPWLAAWNFLRGPYPTLLSRVIVGGVFLLAGVSKALDMHAFAGEISAYQIVPASLVQPMAVALPLLEILIAVYLLVGLAQSWTAAAAGALLLVFIGAMAWALARGLTLDCGCFGNALGVGVLRETVSAGSIARDVLWLALCIHLLLVPSIWSLDAFRQARAR